MDEEQKLTAEGSRRQNAETANVAFATYLCVLFTLVETTIVTFLAVLMKHILAVSFILVKTMDEICSAWKSFDSPLKSLLPKGSLLTTLATSNGPALKCPLTAAPLSFPPTCIFASKIELVDFLAAWLIAVSQINFVVSVKAKYARVVGQPWRYVVFSALHLIQPTTHKYVFPGSITANKNLIQKYLSYNKEMQRMFYEASKQLRWSILN